VVGSGPTNIGLPGAAMTILLLGSVRITLMARCR
jgi:hypothetical protein